MMLHLYLTLWCKLRRRLRLLRSLRSPADWWLFCRIFLFALLVPWRMRKPLPVVDHWLTPQRRQRPVDARHVATILTYTQLAIAVGRPLVQPRCLTRGVTLYYFLRRAGLAVDLHFGVSQRTTPFLAHCWLVLDSQSFAEPCDPCLTFTMVYRLPAPPGGEVPEESSSNNL